MSEERSKVGKKEKLKKNVINKRKKLDRKKLIAKRGDWIEKVNLLITDMV